LNADPAIHVHLMQLPLPAHLHEEAILNSISLEKERGRLPPGQQRAAGDEGREPLFAPCTPVGVIELLDRSGIEIAGKKAVVLGPQQHRRAALSHVVAQTRRHRHRVSLALARSARHHPPRRHPDRRRGRALMCESGLGQARSRCD
jgi:5,10-methylene-tetrahydrofolate dehydrogenase/methenyl tetrahydrofolate cyclohydrolase